MDVDRSDIDIAKRRRSYDPTTVGLAPLICAHLQKTRADDRNEEAQG